MFGSVFSTVTGFLDSRFLVNYFLPSLLFSALLVVVWVVGNERVPEAVSWWGQSTAQQTFQITGFLVWVLLFAHVVASRAEAVLRFYEGYWDFPGGDALRRLGQSWHQRRLARIGAALNSDWRRYQEIYAGYPLPTQPDEVMPTRLGNILKNAELYPRDRYNIDAVLIWPRLYPLLPPAFTTTITGLRGNLDFMLVISSLAALFALLSGPYLLYLKASPFVFLSCFGGGALVAYVAYSASLGSALLYAHQIKSAFDLYRNELLKQMRVAAPATRAAERAVWGQLCYFLYRNIGPASWAYESPDAAADAATAAASVAALLTEARRRG